MKTRVLRIRDFILLAILLTGVAGMATAQTMFVKDSKVGVGIDNPSETLHIFDDADELKMRLEQGTPGVNAWAYSVVNSNPAAPDAFRISKQGSGGPEVEFHERFDSTSCDGGNCPTMEVFGSIRATNVSFTSSRALKTDIVPVDGKEVLRRLEDLPISKWRLKTDPPSVHHIGPMAEDFKDAFDLPGSGTTISVVDTNGLALAAIKGLHEEVQERDRQIAELASQLVALKEQVRQLTTADREPTDD